ncbi:MAG: hypothetical protein AB7J46_06345 [Candidatus Altimarinota bacterium]
MAWYNQVDSEKKFRLGTRKKDVAGNEYIYLAGVSSNAEGKFVVFDESFATTLLTADEVGPVGVSMGAFDATTEYGWAQIYGKNTVASTDTVAADKQLFIDGTAGRADDADVAGDFIVGAYSMSADTANVASVWLNYPSVGDAAHD